MDPESDKFTPRQNKTRSFENMVMSYFQRFRPQCEVESFKFLHDRYTEKVDAYKIDGFCGHCNTVFQAMGCFYHFCPCQEAHLSVTDEKLLRGNKKKARRTTRTKYTGKGLKRH